MSRHEAAAYVELADETIRRAWRYQSIWLALEVGQVPAKLRREVLDRRLSETRTQAVEVFDRWANSPAVDVPLIVEGPMGRGKSFSAARWLCQVADRGESVAWLSAKRLSRLPFERDRKREADRDIVTLADEERRGLKACAMVIDDLGAGVLSATVMARINALILTREEDGLGTAILLNENRDNPKWARETIDKRVFDRMRTRNLKIVRLDKGASMRGGSEGEKVDDERGRGAAWFASASLLRTVGVVDEFDNSAWLPEQRRVIMQPSFGLALQGHARRPDWPDVLAGLCRDANIAVTDVLARAAQLQRAEDGMRDQFEHADLDLGGDRVVRGADGFLAKLVQDLEHDRGRHGGPLRAGDLLAGREPKPRPLGPEPTFTDGERQQLFAMGYRVHRTTLLALTEEFELRHTRPGSNGRDPKRSKQRLLSIHPTEARAWDAARQLQLTEDNGSWKTEKATA